MSSTKWRLIVAAALVIAIVAFALCETVVRAITKTNPQTGVPFIGRVAFLPYRPDAKVAESTWDQDRAEAATYIVHDDQLGWAIKANGTSGEGGQYTATAQGFRGPRGATTTSAVPKGTVRVSVYGDSFTHGDHVALKDTWPDQLQHLGADLEVLNFGVPGYGTDQAFLRFRRDGRKFEAQFHILGIWPEDIVRNLSVIRFYLTPNGSLSGSKPRLMLTAGNLETVNSPVMSREVFLDTVLQRNISPLVKHDYWYREDEQRFPFYYYSQTVRAAFSVYNAYRRRSIRNQFYADKDGDGLKVTAAIAEAFRNEVEALGSRAYVLIIPMRDLLAAHASGAFPLVEMLKARSIPVIDAGPAFAATAKEVGAAALYLPDGHLAPRGNQLIAAEVHKALAGEFERARKNR